MFEISLDVYDEDLDLLRSGAASPVDVQEQLPIYDLGRMQKD